MIAAVEIIKAIHGKTNELRRALHELVPLCQKEEGCIMYELYEPIAESGEFLVLMKWKDMNALSRHEKSKAIEHFVQKYDQILYGEVTQTEWKYIG